MNFDIRIFEYSRKDKLTGDVVFFAQLIYQGYDLICFGDCKIPSGISEETALAFFDEAEQAAIKKMEDEFITAAGD